MLPFACLAYSPHSREGEAFRRGDSLSYKKVKLGKTGLCYTTTAGALEEDQVKS